MDNIEATELVIRWIATKTALNAAARSNKSAALIEAISAQAADLQRQMRANDVTCTSLPPQHRDDLFVRYRVVNGDRQTDQAVLKWLLQARIDRIMRGQTPELGEP